jgi:hypothetical protein
MVELGLLTDEAGNKLTSLEGITFAETLSQGFTRVITAIERLVNALLGVGDTADRVARGIPRNPFADWQVPAPEAPEPEPGAGGAQGGLVTRHGIQHFAQGGRVLPFLRRRGADSVPALLTPGEVVLTEDQQAAVQAELNRNLNIPGMSGVQREVQGLRQDAALDRALTPKQIARAVRDELQKMAR